MAESPRGAPAATAEGSPRRRFALPSISWRPSPLSLTIAVAVVVNILAAAAFLWSRGGQTTTVTFDVRGPQVDIFVDGEEAVRGFLPDMPPQGGVVIRLEDTTTVPSLPRPRGLEHVKVTDLSTDETLFESDLSEFSASDWTSVTGNVSVQDGALGTREPATLRIAGDDWTDYRVEVRFRNIQAASVAARASDEVNGAIFSFRPFRHHDSSLRVMQNGTLSATIDGGLVELSRSETIKSMLAMWMRFYPLAVAVTLGAIGVVFLLQFVPIHRLPRPTVTWSVVWVYVAPIAFAAFAVTLYLNYSYGSHMAHVPDEVSYLFQAKLLASGNFTAPRPPVEESFDFFYPPLITITEQGWASVYPFGHPLVLAPGELLNVVWIVPPLIGGACVAMIFGFGRRVYSTRLGLLAAALLALSPFFLMTASNFMSHNTAVLYLLLSLFFLASGDRRLFTYSVLAGVFFGLLFNTRPLTSFALVPPFGVMLLSGLVHADRRRIELRRIAGFIAGGLLMLLAYWVYNYFTTGSFFQPGYETGGDLNQTVGFGGAHSVAKGIQNEQTQLAFLVLVLNNWPQVVGLMFIMLPFLLGSRNRWDWFCLACAVCVMGAWAIYEAPGIAHGPRYWYESLPFLTLLAARGADRLGEVAAGIAQWGRRKAFESEHSALWAGVAVSYGLILVLAVAGSNDWLRGDGGGWRVDQMPASAKELKGYNGADDRLVRLVEEADLEDALVMVETCPNWQCYGTMFALNVPTLDGDVVYARNLERRNLAVFKEFPGRRVYRATYVSPSLVPWGITLAPGEQPDPSVQAPLATEIPPPTPAPTATPDVFSATRRDTERRSDLEELVLIVEEYYERNGTYPLATDIQTLCVYPFDAACALQSVREPLPKDPNPQAYYWYQSDGNFGFSIYAAMELPVTESGCPDPKPAHLAGVTNLYCREVRAD